MVILDSMLFLAFSENTCNESFDESNVFFNRPSSIKHSNIVHIGKSSDTRQTSTAF